MRPVLIPALLACAALAPAACTRPAASQTETRAMTPQVTLLHLLKDTPFFTRLTRPQLQWVIDHSREWGAPAGTVVASRITGQPASDDYWILLDGGWKVEANGTSHPAGHADPGKWFSAADVTQDCRLVTTAHSYVMQITRAEMTAMVARGFAFGAHLEAGRAYYQSLF